MGTPERGSPLPTSVTRLWRPAAQRNLRNQWSKLASCRSEWFSCSSAARSHATSLVNAFLSQKYVPSMELGILNEMPDIRNKACSKLFKQQELHQRKLLSSYKDMVAVVTRMVNVSRLMRCYVKGPSSSPILQFSTSSENNDDNGDGAGIPVFAFWSISYFEQLAEELVQMFTSELNLKRLLVAELLTLSCEGPQLNELCWSYELYPGEFNDLSICNLYSIETCKPVPPGLVGRKYEMPTMQFKNQPNREVLQVYLTTWLAEVNIDTHRVDEIFAIIGDEMHVSLS
ncbi:uncharacterized protein LOC8284444 isoform X1 [Ricinus communis]|uniref:Uncharacterized protein n=1 Tax=Ricinus communis TaxID=3988 RepID=B9RLQ0_RICCO|nr:uncharacterized protein LOC8284444 isoform X1 [Ricinus communis]EEF47775.1 conserved hypothetical protein [Ricinus communis]|eukprot:XP_002514669.1 uncharacterized protein LOC8284444 [Ricinus communis]